MQMKRNKCVRFGIVVKDLQLAKLIVVKDSGSGCCKDSIDRQPERLRQIRFGGNFGSSFKARQPDKSILVKLGEKGFSIFINPLWFFKKRSFICGGNSGNSPKDLHQLKLNDVTDAGSKCKFSIVVNLPQLEKLTTLISFEIVDASKEVIFPFFKLKILIIYFIKL